MAIEKVTKKRKDTIVLPGETTIYQSNRITHGKFKGFTLLQSKILLCLIKNLQREIKTNMSGGNWTEGIKDLRKEINQREWVQGKIFDDKGMLQVSLKLSEITKPRQYKDVYEAAKELQSISVELKSPQDGYMRIASLIPIMDVPKLVNGNSTLLISMFKEVAEKIIEVDKKITGQPQFFTKYLYEVAMAAKNKYTYKLYMIISSWKEKGGFKISYTELREQLGLSEEVYPEYASFKRCILIPVQKELEKKADCWFNCKEKTFEIRERKKVVSLNFKVIVPEMVDDIEAKIENIKHLLRMHLKFKDTHMKALAPLFSNDMTQEKVNSITNKVTDIYTYISSVRHTEKKVADEAAYTVKSLLNTDFSAS